MCVYIYIKQGFEKGNGYTKSAPLAAAAKSELTCLKSMHGLPHPFSTTIKGTEEELFLEPSWMLIIASTRRPPVSAALRRISQCWGNNQHHVKTTYKAARIQ